MNKIVRFLSYVMTNFGIMLVFAVGCFVIPGICFNHVEVSALHHVLSIFIFLVIFSSRRFLVKKTIPEPFIKGNKPGLLYLLQSFMGCIAALIIATLYKSPSNLTLWCKMYSWIGCAIALYCHFRWGRRGLAEKV